MRACLNKCLLYGILMVVPGHAAAAWVWGSDLRVELRSGYDGNLRLGVLDELNTPLYRVSTDWTVRAGSERTALDLSISGIQAEYPDLNANIDTDFRLQSSLRHNFETWGWFLDVGRQRINTLANALDDAGVLDDTVQREQDTYAIGLSWQFSDRGSVLARSSRQQVDYLAGSSFEDFEFSVQSAEMVWESSERRALLATIDYSDFETEFGTNRSTTRGASIGLRQQFSPTLNGTIRIGRNWTDTTSVNFFGPFRFLADESSTDFRLDAELQKRWLKDDLTMTVGQQVQPAGNGILTTRSYASASWRHRFSEKVSVRLITLLRDFDEVNDFGGSENDRRAARFTLALDVVRSPQWIWSFEASHRTQAFELRDDVARGDRFFVSLVYRFDRGAS